MATYTSDLNTVITNILGKLSGKNLDLVNSEIATNIQASNLRRIHNQGRNVEGRRIGNYSIKPMYVNPKSSPKKFQPKGKHGQTNFKSGKPHKTKYFDTGYYGFRRGIGRDATNVNLQLTGGLKASFQIRKLSNGYAIGFWTGNYADRAVRLEEHFGKTDIWGVTKEDTKVVDTIIAKYI